MLKFQPQKTRGKAKMKSHKVELVTGEKMTVLCPDGKSCLDLAYGLYVDKLFVVKRCCGVDIMENVPVKAPVCDSKAIKG